MKGNVMNKPIEPVNKSIQPETNDKQRGIGVVELLFTIATLGATVLVTAMNSSKRPASSGD